MGKYRRWLLAWMARAMTSLPVPLSPRIRTVASVLATCSTSSMTFRIGGLSPTISSTATNSSMVSRSCVFSSRSRRCSSARRTRWLSSSGSIGLVT